MGRKEAPINGTSPLAHWARRPRQRREQAGSPRYRAMRDIAHFSHSVLAEAASGRKLPSWEVTEGYLTALGDLDPGELAEWKSYHTEVERTLSNLARKTGKRRTIAEKGQLSGESTAGLSTAVEHVEPEQIQARPERVRTYDDLTRELNTLRINAGAPTFRSIAARAHWAPSTICEVFQGQRRPALDLLLQIIVALQNHPAGIPTTPLLFARTITSLEDLDEPEDTSTQIGKDALSAWTTAWQTAEYNRQRPDLRSRSRRLENTELLAEHQNRGPSIDILATMAVPTAAVLLGQMHPELAAAMLREMPTARSAAILSQMYLLSAQGAPETAVPRTVTDLPTPAA
jgi:hypothetical protein